MISRGVLISNMQADEEKSSLAGYSHVYINLLPVFNRRQYFAASGGSQRSFLHPAGCTDQSSPFFSIDRHLFHRIQ